MRSCVFAVLTAVVLTLAVCARAGEVDAIAAFKKTGSDPTQIPDAIRKLSKAAADFEKSGKNSQLAEISSYLYWCRKQMSDADFEAFSKTADAPTITRIKNIMNPPDPGEAQGWFEQVEAFAKATPEEHWLIGVRFSEISERFPGTEYAKHARTRATKALELAGKATAAAPEAKPRAGGPDVTKSLVASIPANSDYGFHVGRLPAKSKIEYEYLSGKWQTTSDRVEISPDLAGKKEHLRAVAVDYKISINTFELLSAFPDDTVNNAQTLALENPVECLILRIGSPADVYTNSGTANYRLWLPQGVNPLADFGTPSKDGLLPPALDDNKSQIVAIAATSATSGGGYKFGPVKVGTTIWLKYMSGKWKSGAENNEVSPDAADIKSSARLALSRFNASNSTSRITDVIPANTKTKVYGTYVLADADQLMLSILNNTNPAGSSGSVEYRVWIVPPGSTQPIKKVEPAVASNDSVIEKKIDEATRVPVPDAARLKDAEKSVRENFKADYAATEAEDKMALAQRLLLAADEAKDDSAQRYVMCREARDISMGLGDIGTAIAATDAMGRYFTLNVVAEKIALLRRASDSLKDKGALRALAECSFIVFKEAISADQFESLKALAALGELSSTRAAEPDLIKKSKEITATSVEILKEWMALKSAQEKLKVAPNDPTLNTTVGRFYCFLKDDWVKGLRALSLGSNKDWKTVADKELANPADGPAMMAVGDGWWDVAEKFTGLSKQLTRMHAVSWYKQAFLKLDGATRARAEARIMLAIGPEAIEEVTLASKNNIPKTATLDLGKGVSIDFVMVPAGRFQMGPPISLPEMPQHTVSITRPIYMAKFETTWEQYESLVEVKLKTPGAKYPAGNLTHAEAEDFCIKLSKLTGKKVRLPTEAEWEYACRAGTKTGFYTGESIANAEKAGWFKTNSDDKSHEVGEKEPNAWGLYDMHGNVSEWCQDFYARDYYTKSPAADPVNVEQSKSHVARGGAYSDPPNACRSLYRRGFLNDSHFGNLGFRVVMEAEAAPPAAK